MQTMQRKKSGLWVLTGMLALLALVFGVGVMGCSGDDDEDEACCTAETFGPVIEAMSAIDWTVEKPDTSAADAAVAKLPKCCQEVWANLDLSEIDENADYGCCTDAVKALFAAMGE